MICANVVSIAYQLQDAHHNMKNWELHLHSVCNHSGAQMKGRVAYASQSPWIRAGSVKQNILFELPEEKERYDEIIEACALGPDLQQLPSRDDTELGERGINLSGMFIVHVS